MNHRSTCYKAKWIVPLDGEPIENGIVESYAGKIVSVSKTTPIESAEVIDLGEVALLPALINCHTHLEFSNLPSPFPAQSGMAAWIGDVVRWRRSQVESSPEPREQIAAEFLGLQESNRFGTAVIGDISTSHLAWHELSRQIDNFPDVVAFGELIGNGLVREEISRRWFEDFQSMCASERARSLGDQPATPGMHDNGNRSFGLTTGISPHAPYTVNQRLFRWCLDRSRREQMPLAMHLGESLEEQEYIESKRGNIAEMLDRFGASNVDWVDSPKNWLEYLEMLRDSHLALVVHANYFTQDHWQFLAERREKFSAVYCPRTHRHFGHSPYPLQMALQAGARVVLGTDSKASNPDLSLWREMVELKRAHPWLSAEKAVRMGTIDGAEALGVHYSWGAIAPGKRSRFVAIPVATTQGKKGLLEALLESPVEPMPIG